MSLNPLVKVEQKGCVGVILLARPDKFNCLSSAVFHEMETALDSFERDGNVAAVVISGLGKHFCTGAELDEVNVVRQDPVKLLQFLKLGHHVLNRFEESPLPVLTAIEGLCLAGGMELMLASDVVFAGRQARFGDQHGQFGLIPGWGGSQRLPKIVGQRRALDLFLSVRWIEAKDAEAWGLINYVVDEGTALTAAMSYAEKIGTRSASGMALMKRLARSVDQDAMRASKSVEIELALSALTSRDVEEGLAAFKSKREPIFPFKDHSRA